MEAEASAAEEVEVSAALAVAATGAEDSEAAAAAAAAAEAARHEAHLQSTLGTVLVGHFGMMQVLSLVHRRPTLQMTPL